MVEVPLRQPNWLKLKSLLDMFISKRKSRLTPRPSLRPDVLSRYSSKCGASTILSVMQDKSEKKRYSHNYPQTFAFASPLPPPPAQSGFFPNVPLRRGDINFVILRPLSVCPRNFMKSSAQNAG